MKTAFLAALLAAASVLPATAWAQLHQGDIEMSIVDNRITLVGNDASHGDGLAVFEADFGDLGGGPYRTDDPGFDSDAGAFAMGTLINYSALGNLQFWNGSAWAALVPASEFLRLDGNLGEQTRWHSTGVLGDTSGLVGQAGAAGQVHEHLDFSVARTGGGVPSVGAYLVQLQLVSPSYSSSAPFYMAFNRGLSEADFETAVGALAAVPEGQTWALMGLGLLAIGAHMRRRSNR